LGQKAGVLDKLFEKIQEEQIVRIKIEAVSLDRTIVKVHPGGTAAFKKRTASHRQIPRRMEHQIVKRPKMAFRVLIIGGTGQVGAAVVRALAAEPSCAEVVMVNRRAISLTADPRVRQVILDTAAAQFPAEVTKLAQSMVAQGDPVYGASCVGVGKGSMKWSEEELKALEIGVVGGFARGCQAGGITRFSLLSVVGSTAKSRIRYVRVMGLKEEAVQGIGFQRLAIFRPGIIAGNAHTPRYAAWLGRLVPGPFGTIEQDDIGRAFVAEFISNSAPNGVVYLENGAMRQRSRAFK
jgi:hypothetical protein